MGRDRLSGGSAKAGGRRTAGEPASSDTENGASRETEIRLLAEASRERPRAIRRTRFLPRPSVGSLGRGGDGVPCRGLPWRASPGCRDLLLGARGEEEEDPVGLVATGRGPRLTFLLLLFFRWDLGNPFDVLLGVPHSKVPDNIAHHFGVSENFDMHSLKQVCFYDDMC